MILTAFNKHGTKEMEQLITDQLDRCHVLGVCDTWRGLCDKADKPLLQEEVTTILTHNRQRGYGGIVIAAHTAVMFEVTHTHIQSVRVNTLQSESGTYM